MPCGRAIPDATAVALDNPFVAHSLDEFAVTRDRPLSTPVADRRRHRLRLVSPLLRHRRRRPHRRTWRCSVSWCRWRQRDRAARASEKPVHVRIGDDVKGWTVAAIDARKIVLALDDQTVTFAMFNGGRVTRMRWSGTTPPPCSGVIARRITAHRVTKPAPP